MSPVNTAAAAAAKALRALHIPSKPVLLANVYDVTSAHIVASLPGAQALATASWAVAKAAGLNDPQLDMPTNLSAIQEIAAVARAAGKPLTADFQDGYGEELEAGIAKLIEFGVAGINLEDSDDSTSTMLDTDIAVQRVKRAVAAATAAGVPDFVINARSDSYMLGGTIEESIRRGKLYLEAGAACIYVFSPRGVAADDIKRLVKAFDGRVNVALRLPPPGAEAGALTSRELAALGVSRISVGPQIYLAAAEAIRNAAQKVFALDAE